MSLSFSIIRFRALWFVSRWLPWPPLAAMLFIRLFGLSTPMTPDVHLSVYLRVFLFSWSIIYPSRLKPRTARTSKHALFFSLLPIKCSASHTKKQTNKRKNNNNKQTNKHWRQREFLCGECPWRPQQSGHVWKYRFDLTGNFWVDETVLNLVVAIATKRYCDRVVAFLWLFSWAFA